MDEKKQAVVSEMTVRDLFAGLAMAGLLANGENPAEESTVTKAVTAADNLLAALTGRTATTPKAPAQPRRSAVDVIGRGQKVFKPL